MKSDCIKSSAAIPEYVLAEQLVENISKDMIKRN
jgi:hypothetical protein